MAGSVSVPASAAQLERVTPRHSALVRVTHWLTTLAFFALLVTGVEIVFSHPRFYWGEAGNVNTRALFQFPIPSSRGTVPTGYGYVLPDQNGWSRYLHFQSAWLLVLTGLLYLVYGALSGHFRNHLLPRFRDLSRNALSGALRDHFGRRLANSGLWSYNTLQRLTYSGVIFLFFPLIIWTGLAMSPGFASAFPWMVAILGGQQSARTIHFLDTVVLTAFVLVHVVMVCATGFRSRMRAMIAGSHGKRTESR